METNTTTETVAIIASAAFIVGTLFGMLVPIICIKIYNALDLSFDELCAEEEEEGGEKHDEEEAGQEARSQGGEEARQGGVQEVRQEMPLND